MLTQDFYSIDQFLVSQQTVPFKFFQPAESVGYLNPGGTDTTINQGDIVNIPIWLARSLVNNHFGQILTPQCLETSNKNMLISDPTACSLSEVPNIYEYGIQLASIGSGMEDHRAFLTQIWGPRFQEILTKSHTYNRELDRSQISRLSELEKKIFAGSTDAIQQLEDWHAGGTEQLKASKLAQT
ncbi:putative GINS complex subunit 3 [Blattamonas nauphoetae]|uniref:GINS complex subunit 3 n=1 Tax=Blattamonas nauphoetae TaxID=2049346 RepID=A0ABQ9YFX6_9EUKA|nr:putative GINS complex subunit 3 [Blattamonas nauphoetae]